MIGEIESNALTNRKLELMNEGLRESIWLQRTSQYNCKQQFWLDMLIWSFHSPKKVRLNFYEEIFRP